MYTDIDYDGQPFYKWDNLSRISMKIYNFKQQVARMHITYDKNRKPINKLLSQIFYLENKIHILCVIDLMNNAE